jgi:protein-S-isoprenylcysteine O-methyltransferase Ste14
MSFLEYLTITLLATWLASEAVISLISLRNRLRGSPTERDRFSSFVIWVSIVSSFWFAVMIWRHVIFTNGFGSFSTLSVLLGYLGCFVMVLGIAIRAVAVATLRRQFTITVSIVEKHAIVDTGLYRIVRHPAYLGVLVFLLGFGLASGNWFSLAALVGLPLAALLYRIQVEERVLLRHFGQAYEAYASRTKRLLPGIW